MDLSQTRKFDFGGLGGDHVTDARIAMCMLDELQARGYAPHTVTVGAVTFGLATYTPRQASEPVEAVDDASDAGPARPQRKSRPEPGIYEEHGADLLGQFEEEKERRDDE